MYRIFCTLLVLAVLAACQPIAPASPTAAPVPVTPSAAPPAPTKTPIPPTETQTPPPTEVKANITPEEMTKVFNPANLEAMPVATENTMPQVRQSAMEYLKTPEGGSIINPDDSVNKPEGVMAAKPDQWVLLIEKGDKTKGIPGGDQILIPSYKNYKDKPTSVAEYPFQPTNLLFKVTDASGNVTGILVTELLYYEDASSVVKVDKVEPVFFFGCSAKVRVEKG